MLTTFPVGPGFSGKAAPHCRPMYTQKVDPKTFDGTLWFMTNAASANVSEIAENSAVMITYADQGKNHYVAVSGNARAVRNPQKARELWNVHAKGWFPDGPADASLMLLEVRVESAEYWDGPSSASYFLSLMKAVATGTRVQAKTEHGEI